MTTKLNKVHTKTGKYLYLSHSKVLCTKWIFQGILMPIYGSLTETDEPN